MRPCASGAEMWSNKAPKILMSSLLAERILVVTGIRSEVLRPSFWSKLVPAKQLWHPVSANAMKVEGPARGMCVTPKAVGSPLKISALSVIVGWGCDFLLIHVFRRLS